VISRSARLRDLTCQQRVNQLLLALSGDERARQRDTQIRLGIDDPART